ncbi:integrase arm-type DNA-binding domain-containing protein [Haemophilus pittmaniae]|uniref:integrase arm-type DNA-binding domain-containing protein n=1 Tax=Haemophilus pittmaniae TaxID=249188 RepID=UPI0028DD3E5E|nr:integrase arm-type DNA-binding domain-containing protein [Haemophilus pittmaniae]
MARATTPLSDSEIKAAKYPNADLRDGKGLFLTITSNNVKLWRLEYRPPHKKSRTMISLGRYPDISLAKARELRENYRSLLAQGIDPQQYIEEQKQLKEMENNNTFDVVAEQWFMYRKTRANFSDDYAKDIQSLIRRILTPVFGGRPIAKITAPMAIEAFRPLQEKGTLETLKRVIRLINEIMNYALHRAIIEHNPLANISREFDAPRATHFKTIRPEPEELPAFFDVFNKARISQLTRYLILWQMLTMTRPNEAATAKYEDIDESARIWTIFINKGIKVTEQGREHKVTLSTQAIALLREIKKLSGNSKYLFPSVRNPATHCNSQTANAAIKRMGFKDKLVAHGLRSIASTYLNEKGFNKDQIEVALSHVDKDQIRAAYNRADYIKQRFEILQAWGDFIEESAEGSLPKLHLKFA